MPWSNHSPGIIGNMYATYMHEANTDYYKVCLTMGLEPLSCFCYWKGLVKYTCAIVGIKECVKCDKFDGASNHLFCTKVIENAKSSNETTVGQIMLLMCRYQCEPFKIKLHHINIFAEFSKRLKGSAKNVFVSYFKYKMMQLLCFLLTLMLFNWCRRRVGRLVNVTGSGSSGVVS